MRISWSNDTLFLRLLLRYKIKEKKKEVLGASTADTGRVGLVSCSTRDGYSQGCIVLGSAAAVVFVQRGAVEAEVGVAKGHTFIVSAYRTLNTFYNAAIRITAGVFWVFVVVG